MLDLCRVLLPVLALLASPGSAAGGGENVAKGTVVVFPPAGTDAPGLAKAVARGIRGGLSATAHEVVTARKLSKKLRGADRQHMEACGGDPVCLGPVVARLGGSHGVVATLFEGDGGEHAVHIRLFTLSGEVAQSVSVRLVPGANVVALVSERVTAMVSGGREAPTPGTAVETGLASGDAAAAGDGLVPGAGAVEVIESAALEDLGPPVDGISLAAPPPPPAAVDSGGVEHLLTYVGLGTTGLAVVLAVVGGYFGYRSWSLRRGVEPGRDSLFAADRKLERAESAASLANVFYLGAAGAAAIGGTLILVDLAWPTDAQAR